MAVAQYSVMQLDGSSFYGDVVLDSMNMAFRDKDSILDQIYGKLMFSDFDNEDQID